MRKRLFVLLRRDLKKNNYTTLADKIGLPVNTLWRVLNGKRSGSIDTWEKIDRYYR